MLTLPTLHELTKQRQIRLLGGRPLLNVQQLPDVFLNVWQLTLVADWSRWVVDQQGPVFILVETTGHSSSPLCRTQRASARRGCRSPAVGIRHPLSVESRCRRC